MIFIEALREAIAAYFEGIEQPDTIYATYTGEGLKIDATLLDVPMENVDVPALFSQQGMEAECQKASGDSETVVLKSALNAGDKVIAAVHHGGQRYSILYKL